MANITNCQKTQLFKLLFMSIHKGLTVEKVEDEGDFIVHSKFADVKQTALFPYCPKSVVFVNLTESLIQIGFLQVKFEVGGLLALTVFVVPFPFCENILQLVKVKPVL